MKPDLNLLKKEFFSFFFPNRCPVCDGLLHPHEQLCPECGEAVLAEHEDYCHRCGKFACICKHRLPVYDAAAVCSAYPGDGTSRAVLGLKTSRNTNFAFFSAEILSQRLQYQETYGIAGCVMPVPMHPSKQHTRGYNQASLIGKEIARLMQLPFREDVLYKTKSREQHTLNAAERAENVSCFGIRDVALNGMRIILCDDILTTGSTMNRCAELLKQQGASAVIAAAAASTAAPEHTRTEETP